MIIEQAVNVLKIEGNAILDLAGKINDNFVQMIELILNSKGRVIFSGIGKSGLIGCKIVATLNSTGTNSLFLHPVEAMHGDLGIVDKNDIFIGLSNSGETEELNLLIPTIQKIGCPIIAFTGNTNSTLSKKSNIVIDVGVKKEACPLGLAPTTSSTALLAMGDALAVVLINKKHFNSSDFKKVHPGGSLGHRLSNAVSNIMLTGENIPCVLEGIILKEAISEMNQHSLGVIFITDRNKILSGIITDGDIRSFIATGTLDQDKTVDKVMIKNPRTVYPETPVYDALNKMEKYQITVLPVINIEKRILGILHLHDILGKGTLKFKGA